MSDRDTLDLDLMSAFAQRLDMQCSDGERWQLKGIAFGAYRIDVPKLVAEAKARAERYETAAGELRKVSERAERYAVALRRIAAHFGDEFTADVARAALRDDAAPVPNIRDVLEPVVFGPLRNEPQDPYCAPGGGCPFCAEERERRKLGAPISPQSQGEKPKER